MNSIDTVLVVNPPQYESPITRRQDDWGDAPFPATLRDTVIGVLQSTPACAPMTVIIEASSIPMPTSQV
ncbi:hypothetical protein [Parazoarcus communis]|uniref:hypothetical protein n=1 Tax=Parazoarcus communis TaxID=41977 RepID=UPI0014597F34|nr:hypothetical protein [Parazoarcus communis]